jgi:hypothetical protein
LNHTDEYLEAIAPDIKTAAERVSRQFPSLEYDDIYQNLWVYALETKTELIPGGGSAVAFLVQEGRRQCGKELAERNPRADDFFYTPGVVKKMLDAGLLYYHGGDVAGRSDLLVAYRAISEGERDTITAAFLDRDESYFVLGGILMAEPEKVVPKWISVVAGILVTLGFLAGLALLAGLAYLLFMVGASL